MSHSFEPFSREHLQTVLVGSTCVAAFLVSGRRGGGLMNATANLLASIKLAAYLVSLFTD